MDCAEVNCTICVAIIKHNSDFEIFIPEFWNWFKLIEIPKGNYPDAAWEALAAVRDWELRLRAGGPSGFADLN